MAPVLATISAVASIDRVMALNVQNRTICPGFILVHQGVSSTGSGLMVGDISCGSTLESSVVISLNGEAEADKPEELNGDAGFRVFFRLLDPSEGSTSPPGQPETTIMRTPIQTHTGTSYDDIRTVMYTHCEYDASRAMGN
jgi:hypothetical protein